MEKTKARVEEIIWNNEPSDYDKYLKDADWDTFYELSTLREGLLNWYSFKENGTILFISDGYGALVGLLAGNCEHLMVLEAERNRAESIRYRYRNCWNIDVLIGGMEQLPDHQQYDYIVVEKAAATKDELYNLLMNLCPFLKKSGRMFISCDNKLGLKYLCGVPDPVDQIPFGGLNDREKERLTRADILHELAASKEIKGYCMYYPAPDWRLPQAIYSDRYLPKKSTRDRVIPYYTEDDRRKLVCMEDRISDEIISNELFPALANSILIECGKEEFEQEVLFAALSTDRGHEHGFATVITRMNTVRKKILHPAGRKGLELIYRNQQELERRGIACVSAQLFSDAIEMPFIQGENCMDYLGALFADWRKKEIEEVFDQLYQMILQSSRHLSFECCQLSDAALKAENIGPVLEKAYIDMIPYNCFYRKEEGKEKLLFYDQEFVKKSYPAKYVLFRALRYTYIYIAGAENVIPLQFFKTKYDLDFVWEAFEREESRFVEDNRNYNLLSSFYKWASISEQEIENGMGGERRQSEFQKKTYGIDIYNRDYELNKIKNIQKDLLARLIEVCEENNLMYCVFYGTLLGTVRHKGYIPWDDDVDILMPRKDYDRLTEIAHTFEQPYFLQTPESDPECFYGGYAKLRNGNTTGIEERNEGHSCNQGIWIDIFPLDCVLKQPEEKKKQQENILKYQRLLLKKTYPEKRMLWDLPENEEEKIRKACRWYSRERLCRLLHDTIANYGTEISDRVAVMARYQFGRPYIEYQAKDFEFVIPGMFEDLQVMMPVGYEECLLAEYGGNYLYYAPVRERKPHHQAVFDVDVSYIDYIVQNRYNK